MRLIVLSIIVILFTSCNTKKESPFSFVRNEQGVELLEHGRKVFFYQKTPVLVQTGEQPNQKHLFNHYIHPLYNLEGAIITEAQPENDKWHPHHRGIFWAWHQIEIAGKPIADSWIMKDFSYSINSIKTSTSNNSATLILDVDWKSAKAVPETFVTERTLITVHPIEENIRLIDFDIELRANVPEVTIAGSKDTIKGYGGFSARIKLADSMMFRGQAGVLKPILGQVKPGPWVDFATPELSKPNRYGLVIFCHPSIPNFPSPWLLRSKSSMQNPAFPGWNKFEIPMDTTLKLRYRLVVYDGNMSIADINSMYNNYKNK